MSSCDFEKAFVYLTFLDKPGSVSPGQGRMFGLLRRSVSIGCIQYVHKRSQGDRRKSFDGRFCDSIVVFGLPFLDHRR